MYIYIKASFKEHIEKKGFELRAVEADGNCLYRAIADQVCLFTMYTSSIVNKLYKTENVCY